MANPFELPDDSAAPAPVEQNPFALPADTIAAPQRLRLALDIASRENPEQSAIAQHIARTANVPLGVVERNLPEFQRQAKLADLNPDRLATDAPATARFLSDVNAAKLAHDDVERLAELEALMRQSSITSAPSALAQGARALASGVPRLSQGMYGTLAGGAGVLRAVLDPFSGQDALLPILPANPAAPLEQALLGIYQGQADLAKTVAGDQSNAGFVGQGVLSGLESLGQNLPMMAAAVVAGQPALALYGMSASTAGQAYGTAREKGIDPAKAVSYALLQGYIEKTTEEIPVAQLFKDLGVGAGFWKTLVNQLPGELVGEQVATVFQDLNDWAVLNPEKPFSSYIDERGPAAVQTLIATVVGTGGNVAVAQGVDYAMRGAERKVQKAMADAERLQAAMGAAAQSQLRERSPETFQQLAEQIVAENEGAQSIFIDGQVLAQSGVDIAQAFPSLADQVNEAAFLNSTVEIPLAEVLTAVPGTPLEELFLQNAKSSPDALSQAEVEQAGEQGQQFIQQEAERVLQQAQDQSAWQSEVDTVQQTIKGQLDQAGRFTSDVNEGYARLQSQFFSVMASRFGITPSEMYQRFSVKVAGQMGQGEVLNAGAQFDDATLAETDAMLEANQLDSVDSAYQYMIDDRSHGDEFLAAAAQILYPGEATGINVREWSAGVVALANQMIADTNGDPGELDIARYQAGSSVLNQSAVQRLQMVAERGVRKTGDRAIITAEERAAMESSSAATGVPIAEIEAAVSKTKLAHPVAQGWAPLTYSRTVVDDTNGDRKVTHEYKVISYQFSTDADSKSLEPGTSNYKRRANAVARSMAEEVRTVFRRAGAGDANARNILAQAGWYKALRKRLRQEFGGLGDLFADLLGATSPNTPVRDNWFNAVDALRRASRGDFDNLILQWEAYFDRVDALETDLRSWFNEQLADKLDVQGIVVQKGLSKKAIKDLPEYQEKLSALREARKFPDALLPKKESGAKYGFNGRNVARAMVDLWRIVKNADPDIARGGTAPKALNFSGNLIGFRERATIDVWAARMLQRLAGRRRIPSVAETGVSGEMREDGSTTLQFGFGQDVFSESVRRIRADNELNTDPTLAEMNDDDLQAVVWFIEKELWTVNNWTNAAGEGGSFELEANLTGTSQQDRVKELRSIIDASPPTSDVVAAGQDTSAALKAIEAHEREHAAEIEELRKLQSGEIPPYKGSKKRMEELAKIARPPVEATRLLGNVDRAKGRLEAFNARKVAAKAELTSLEREVDRFVGGLSIQMSMETQGVDFVPADADMNRLAEAIRQAIYAADDANTVLGSKALSTEGRYGGVERSLDLEVVAREGYDANSLWLEMLRQAQEARQDSTFLSRVLRANEDVDLLRHRPGVEIYFRSAADAKNLEVVLADLAKEGVDFLTVIVDGRRLASTMAGEMPAAVGVRLQYVPEFEQRYGIDDFSGLDDVAIAAKMSAKANEMDGLAARVLASVEGVSFAGQFWYDTQVAFSVEYQEKIDALTTGTSEGQAAQARGGIWTGQPLRAGLESADRQLRETASREPGGDVLGGDAGSSDEVLRQSSVAPQTRGTFNPQTLLISLGPQSDLSTFLHESGHFFLEVMADLATQPDAPAQVREDMGKVLGWFGVPDLATWQGYTLEQKRQHHERWAESFEQYLLEGKAPSAELQPLFRRFRAWLVNVYKSLTDFMRGRNLEVNDEIRQVFDRMLATDEQIAQAEEQSGLLPDFDATNAAIERLQERSLRNLKWTLNARSKFLKQFTKEAKELRKGVLAEVMAEFEQRPDVMASRAIRKVRNKDGAERDAKIAAIADATGYPTVEEMTAAVTALGPVNEAVEAEVDRRMLERHGDMATQEALEAAANEAVHNEARARALAAELKSQDEAMNPRETTGRTDARGRPITVNALVEAARAFGADLAARRAVGKLKNAIYLHRAAEARAGKAWQTATKKGDSKAAVQAKKDQLLNNQAVRALLDAQAEVRSAIEFFRKVTKGNNEKLVKGGRDPDVVNAMRAILGVYGIAPRTGKGAMDYLELVQKNDPAMYAVIAPGVNTALANAKPFSELTVEEVRGLTDELKSLWHLAKRSRQMEIDGDLLDLEDLADQLYARMEDIGIPDVLPGETGALTDAELRKRNWLQQAPAILRRVEQWAEAKDGAFGGPFLRFIFQPVKIAADRYRADRLVYRQKFQALVDAIAPTMDKKVIAAPELGYTFGRGHNGIGMAEVLHAILHTGNDSNKRKLLLGRNWATENPDGTLDTSRWDAFIARLITEGTLTKAHYDFAQGVWDLMEETKPLAQKTHRDVFGRYFAEVTANEVQTPFGTYRGGYVPAQADPLLVQDADQRELLETENAGMSYAFPATNKGFTKGRVEYNRPLKLDLRTLPQHIDKVLLFSHMEPAVRGVDRLLRRKKIAQALNKFDPAAINGMLKPWLNRSARQTVETPVSADAGMNRMLSQARARTGMALMMGNLSNTLQQITGFSTALLKVKGSHMRRAVAQYIADPQQLKNTVWSLSPYMADRASNEVAVLSDTLEAILLNPSVYQSAERFTRRHAYFLQTAMDNQMSPIIWTGAYNQALAEGMEDRMARRYADGVIRQTQGSTLPEDVSRIETGTAFARAFTQFVGYFNMLANTNATAIQQIAQEQGLRKGAGKAFGVLMLGMMIPIWVAEVIAQAFRGGPEDDEDDGYLDDWLAAVFGFGTIRGILSGVPVIAQMGQSMVNRFNDNPADDKFSLSPTVSVLESAAAAPQSVYKAIADEGSAQKAVRDMSALITVATGLPAMTLARPLGYAAGVAQGKIEPTGPADFARGMVTGTASPESKTP